jgi:septal ring factor EnvC (AmiA/AmiB activator)
MIPRYGILTLTLLSSLAFAAVPEIKVEDANKESQYQKIKASIQKQTQEYKQALDQIYQINAEVKTLGASRSYLSSRAMNHENRARQLAAEMTELKADIKSRRLDMLKRLRAIYLFSRRDIGQILFSSQTLQDLDRNLSALKRISKNDLIVIKDYAKRLETLKKKDAKLSTEIAKLTSLQRSLAKSERKLLEKQKTKVSIVKVLRNANVQQMQSLISLQGDKWFKTRFAESSIYQLTEVAFFEAKGSIETPIQGEIVSKFGVTTDSDYKFRLVNKGIELSSRQSMTVRSVFKGKVAYAGVLPGHASQGKYVIVDHGDSYLTIYGGLKSLLVSRGDLVKTNEAMGRSIANSKLQFEIRYYNEGIDPRDWFIDKSKLNRTTMSEIKEDEYETF